MLPTIITTTLTSDYPFDYFTCLFDVQRQKLQSWCQMNVKYVDIKRFNLIIIQI
jgi:hypothetical protein